MRLCHVKNAYMQSFRWFLVKPRMQPAEGLHIGRIPSPYSNKEHFEIIRRAGTQAGYPGLLRQETHPLAEETAAHMEHQFLRRVLYADIQQIQLRLRQGGLRIQE